MADVEVTRPHEAGDNRPPPGEIMRILLKAVGSTVVLVVIYYVLPLDRAATWAVITMLAVGLVGLSALVVLQVRRIIASPFPGLRAGEALAISVPLFLLLFASTYLVLATVTHSNFSFSEPMTHTNSLYFTVTVFATVGFGDITATTNAARLLVTAQMVADLVVIGLGARVIVGAVKRGQQRRPPPTAAGPPDT
jgi:voltage-gated potassium channel